MEILSLASGARMQPSGPPLHTPLSSWFYCLVGKSPAPEAGPLGFKAQLQRFLAMGPPSLSFLVGKMAVGINASCGPTSQG